MAPPASAARGTCATRPLSACRHPPGWGCPPGVGTVLEGWARWQGVRGAVHTHGVCAEGFACSWLCGCSQGCARQGVRPHRVWVLTGGGGGRCRGVCALTGCGCSCDVHRGSCKLAGCALALHTHGGAGAHRVICALTGFAHWLPGADARCHPSCQVKIQVPSWILGGGQGASLGFHCCPTGHASAKENTQGGAGGWQPLRCQP